MLCEHNFLRKIFADATFECIIKHYLDQSTYFDSASYLNHNNSDLKSIRKPGISADIRIFIQFRSFCQDFSFKLVILRRQPLQQQLPGH